MSLDDATESRKGLNIGKVILVSLPMLLLTAFLMVGARGGLPRRFGEAVPLFVTLLGVNALFFLMAKTGKSDRFRAILFVTVAISFVLSFIPNLLEMRGSMAFTEEDILRSHIPFCHMVIPMTLVPAALAKTIIHPGIIRGSSHSISSMFVLWIGATLALGRGFCSWGCFFGGIEDGLSRLRKRPLVRSISDRWTYLPYAILIAFAILSAVSLSAPYCFWLCPFKAVSEYEAVTDVKTAIQAVIFLLLFIGLVIVLPILSHKRTQCGLFCPMGAFQGFFNKINLFEVRIDRSKCSDCAHCTRVCPMFSIDKASLAKGKTRISCSKCGKCVDECPQGAATYHVKGTAIVLGERKARFLYLYPAFLFLATLGGRFIQDALRRIILLCTTGSLLS